MLKLAKFCPTGIDMMNSQFDLNVVVRQAARPEAQTGVLRVSCNFTCKILSTLSICALWPGTPSTLAVVAYAYPRETTIFLYFPPRRRGLSY